MFRFLSVRNSFRKALKQRELSWLLCNVKMARKEELRLSIIEGERERQIDMI